MNKSRINRKRLLSLGTLVALLMTVGVWQVTLQNAEAQSTGGFNGAKVVVEGIAVTALTSAAAAAPGTAFYQTGTLFVATRKGCPSGAGAIFVRDDSFPTVPDDGSVGHIKMWGVSAGGNALAVNVNIELPGYNGVLVGQGTLFNVVVDALHASDPTKPCQPFGDDIIVITGGSAGFRGANGEAAVIRQGDGSMAIRLEETPRRGNNRNF